MVTGIERNKTLNIVQRVSIALGAALYSKGQLIASVEQLAYLRLTHWGVNVRQLVVDRLYQTAHGLIDTSTDFLATHTGNIAVHINSCLFHCLSQIELCISVAHSHFCTLCFLNSLIFCQLSRGILTQKTLDLQVGLNLFQKFRITREHDKNFLALTGHYAKSCIIGTAIIPRSQDTQPYIIALICSVGAIIH